MMMKQSQFWFERAQKTIPGGVNSPVRAFKSVGGTPVFFKSAQGSILTDIDGNHYIDYVGSWGPMILGHAHPSIINAIKEKINLGTSFGAPTILEVELAELIVAMVPGIDKVRMVNSGTEACMSAIRLARAVTQKDKIIKFEGCYHGHADSFLIKAGSGAATLGEPNSPGVTKANAADTLTASYNNIEEVKQLFRTFKNQIAAVIVEPVAGNMGCVLPENDFLLHLKNICSEEKSLLIFDEVMTGFRLAKGGAQEKFNVIADIVTFGKIIGGGLPVGAFAARKELMDHISPIGPVYQAGTLSGNPVAMIAGYQQLKWLNDHPEVYQDLEEKTSYLKQQLLLLQLPVVINQIGSMFSIHFTTEAVNDFQTAKKGDNNDFRKFFHYLLQNGIYIPPSPYESWFLSTALTSPQIDKTIEIIAAFFSKNK